MKKLLIILFLSNFCLSQKNQKNIQFTLNDTLFLQRDISNGEYHAIFIDSNKKSDFYDRINNFDIDEFDIKNYNLSLSYFKENNIELKKFNVKEIPKKFVIIKNYQGKFYNYYPSDFMSHFQIQLTDSTIILYTSEGPIANKLDSFEKISDDKYRIKVSGMYSGFSTLIFHIIDKKRGIVIVENQYDENTSNFCIMIDSNKISNLPIIVNYCATRKWIEFNFEEPNYRQLLKK